LTQVAEAFMDCQAVQARVVERIGLQIRGVTTNFRGLVVALVGEYKSMALKMLAAERIAQGKAHDDATPTHYENRLTADIGTELGLNASDVRSADLDHHAQSRFARLRAHEVESAAARARELFDVEALLQALVSELNSFSASSAPDSLSRLFLDWASENITEKHIVFDEETCSQVDVDCTFVMAILEVVFLGRLGVCADRMYRESKLADLFEPKISANEQVVNKSEEEGSYASAASNVVKAKLAIQTSKVQNSTQNLGLVALIGAITFPFRLIEMFGNFFDELWPAKDSVPVSVV